MGVRVTCVLCVFVRVCVCAHVCMFVVSENMYGCECHVCIVYVCVLIRVYVCPRLCVCVWSFVAPCVSFERAFGVCVCVLACIYNCI
jgi:hypothetical protein